MLKNIIAICQTMGEALCFAHSGEMLSAEQKARVLTPDSTPTPKLAEEKHIVSEAPVHTASSEQIILMG